MAFSYWPEGHLAVVTDGADGSNSVPLKATWHWDGNLLLYASTPNSSGGSNASVYLGREAVFYELASSAGTWINVFDRDWTGTAVSGHSLRWTSARASMATTAGPAKVRRPG